MLTLTRSDALDLIDEAEQEGHESLCALAHLWIGHNEHDCATAEDYAAFLRDYVDEGCMDVNGDEIRSRGPCGSDDSGIST